MDNYAVITADVIDSKKSNCKIKELLDEKCEELTIKLEEEEFGLITDISASKGDEIQVVCKDIENVPVIIRYMRFYFSPLKLRIGVGIGTIEEFSQSTNSWDYNGEAFYFAREALDELNDNKKISTRFRMTGKNIRISINRIYSLMDTIIGEWSKAKWKSVQMYDEAGTYRGAAYLLGISKSSVHENCFSAKWDEIKEAEKDISKLLKRKYQAK